MFTITINFEEETGLDRVDPLGDLVISDGRSTAVVDFTFPDVWLQDLLEACNQIGSTDHVIVDTPVEPDPLRIERLPDGRLKVSYKEQSVVAESAEVFVAAVREAARSLLNALDSLSDTRPNKTLDSIREFLSSS